MTLLAILGGEAAKVTLLGLPDAAVPTPGAAKFTQVVARCHEYFMTAAPRTIFLPWRSDPHPDHLEVGGHLLLVHWTLYARDYPLSGDEVHDSFLELTPSKLRHLRGRREEQYRLDLFERV